MPEQQDRRHSGKSSKSKNINFIKEKENENYRQRRSGRI